MVYLDKVRAALAKTKGDEEVEEEVAKVFCKESEGEGVPLGYRTWLAMARGEREDEEDRSAFEMLGNGKVRCRSRLADGRVCAGLGFAPEKAGQHFSECHPRSLFRLKCVVCKKDVSPDRGHFKQHLIESHSELFAGGSDWLKVYSSLVRSEMEERNESGVVIEREMQLLHESERVPSSFARWLERVRRVRWEWE